MGGRNGKKSILIYLCHNVTGSEMPPALSKLERQHDVFLEAVPCSGRIHPRYLLKAFEAGARAVCILACPRGHCRSIEGNLRAVARVQTVQELLSEAGLDPHDVQIFLPSGPEETALARAAENIARVVDEVIA